MDSWDIPTIQNYLSEAGKKRSERTEKSDIPLEIQQSVLMRLSPTYCRIQLFVFSFVSLHMIIPPPCNLYEAPAPHAVTPQGRDSFALFVRRGHLFVVISPSIFLWLFFIFPSGMFHVKWLRLNIHHRAAQKLILLMSLAAWIQSRISKSHFEKKKKIPSLCRSWYYQYTHTPVR